MIIDIKKIKRSFCLQHSQSSCGLACLVSASKLYGKEINEEQLKINTGTTNEGTTFLGLRDAARELGFISNGYEGSIQSLKTINTLTILHIINVNKLPHFILYYGYDQTSNEFIIGDPAIGIQYYTEEFLTSAWKTRTLLTLSPNSEFKKNNTDYSYHRRVLLKEIISPDGYLLLMTFFLSLFTTLLGFTTALFTQKLIDDVLPDKNVYTLFSYIFIYLIIIIIGIFLSFFRDILIIRHTKLFNNRLMATFLGKIFSLPMSFFNSMRIGEVISRIKETEQIQGAIVVLLNSTIIECMTLILSILLLMYYNIEIAFISALSIPIMIVVSRYFSDIIKNRQRRLMINYADFEAYAVESISGIQCIKNYVRKSFFTKKLESEYYTTQETAKELGKINSGYDLIINIVGSVFSIIAMSLGAYYVMEEKLELGQLFAIITILSLTITTTINIISVIIQIQESIVAFERLHDIMSSHDEKLIVPNGEKSMKEAANKIHSLELRNVSFSYPGKTELLHNINMKISTGEFVTLFGDIGTGKSTLLYLIQKFHTIKNGEILFDGDNIDKYSLACWRSYISVVSQNTQIFMGTVADNITLFHSEEINRLKKLCEEYKLSCFLELNSSLNLFNYLSENGINLSGGQKQLIGFTRALFTNSQILVLDEPTASMDKSNELTIMNILQKIKREKIILMITHRPEIAKKTDKIFVLDKNHVIDVGTHEELIIRENTYSKYHSLLFGN